MGGSFHSLRQITRGYYHLLPDFWLNFWLELELTAAPLEQAGTPQGENDPKMVRFPHLLGCLGYVDYLVPSGKLT